ncbi:hypothetical protein M8R19_23850 [Pseudomonas sp. R3.Fl]|nr:hypothetical protein [Pseudomonas sp. R3.Fl]MCL6691732.1 hypothetical protein [Pseudomonas sp. R3.Fl]
MTSFIIPSGYQIDRIISYQLLGAWPDSPLGGGALTLQLALLSGQASAVFGLALGIVLAVLRGGQKMLLVTVLAP